ncbi:MAG: FecR domain-containing protein [Mediterranea sp.]|jgi:ferric-dicitrate binding protein FerR (iron transport regulator)|nr:FecR domain-containing protein [Mediterranea sp.]
MKNPNPSIATRIVRLLTGKLSAKGERQLIDEASMQQAMLRQWDSQPAARLNAQEGEEMYQAIEARMAGGAAPRKRFRLQGWRGYAAAAVVGLTIGLTSYLLYQRAEHLKPPFVEIAAGEPIRYVLPDSSVVWMGRGSSIRYASEFRANRDVNLNGSALFEVTKDANHPFKVHVDRAAIEVKGTIFQVDYKEKRGMYNISLFEGKIDFVSQENGQRTTLLASETLRYNPRNGAIFKEQLTDDVSWKDGYFSFRNVRLDYLINTLDKFYDAEIQIKADVAPQTAFTGSFRVDESIGDIASQICYLLNLRKYIIDDKTIILY